MTSERSGLPAGLLEKTGPLTLDERRSHARRTRRSASASSRRSRTMVTSRKIVRHHHERIDGNGYPDGIAGDDIPLLSRIIAVADAYNAMTSDRPYREAMPSQVARMRLAQAVGSQFDTAVVAAFEAISQPRTSSIGEVPETTLTSWTTVSLGSTIRS